MKTKTTTIRFAALSFSSRLAPLYLERPEFGIKSDTENIPMNGTSEIFERIINSGIHYHFVIDMATL